MKEEEEKTKGRVKIKRRKRMNRKIYKWRGFRIGKSRGIRRRGEQGGGGCFVKFESRKWLPSGPRETHCCCL